MARGTNLTASTNLFVCCSTAAAVALLRQGHIQTMLSVHAQKLNHFAPLSVAGQLQVIINVLIIFPWSVVLLLSFLVNKWQLLFRPVGAAFWWDSQLHQWLHSMRLQCCIPEPEHHLHLECMQS